MGAKIFMNGITDAEQSAALCRQVWGQEMLAEIYLGES